MEISQDKEFKKVITFKEISPRTRESYILTATEFCQSIGKTYSEIISELKEQQYDFIQDNRIIRYDAEQGLTKEYINNYLIYIKEKGNKNSTINAKMMRIRTVLKESGVILPKWNKLTEEKNKKNILLRKDLKFVLDVSNVHQKALFTFLLSTGVRISDALSFTIEDFIISTYPNHQCVTLEDFLEKATDDMIGFWEFTPNKTKRAGLVCKVCNSQESTKYILLSLKERIRLINQHNKRFGTDYQLEITDALFSSRQKAHKGALTRTGVNSIFNEKENKLVDKKKKELLISYKNKEITQKEYKEKLEKLPKFYPHSLRHYFISHLRASGINMQVSLLMEAHSSPNKMDEHYVGENEELFSEKNIREEYNKLLNRLTIEKKISVDEYEELIKTKEQYKMMEEKWDKICEFYNQISDDNIIKRVKV